MRRLDAMIRKYATIYRLSGKGGVLRGYVPDGDLDVMHSCSEEDMYRFILIDRAVRKGYRK